MGKNDDDAKLEGLEKQGDARTECGDTANDVHAAKDDEPYSCMVALQRMFLFHGLSMSELEKIREISYILEVPPERVLIQEGSENNLLYIILEGEVSIYRNKKFVKALTKGNHFGEMALLNSMPRTASVVSTRPSRLVVIERERFVDLITQAPRLGYRITWEMAKQLSIRLDEVMEKEAEWL